MKESSIADKWQIDSSTGWMWMGLYWSIGWLVGRMKGYVTSTGVITMKTVTAWHLVALVLTLLTHFVMDSRQSNFGRKRSWFAVALFAVCNGICETMLFLAFYDIGYDSAKISLHLKPPAAAASGFITLSMYSALIHAFFWLPQAFPRHILPDAAPFHKSALPALVVMSASWIALYEKFNDVATVCCLHILFDSMAASSICLQNPLEKRYEQIFKV